MFKQITIIIVLVPIIFSCLGVAPLMAQTQAVTNNYQIAEDSISQSKILVGNIQLTDLAAFKNFNWINPQLQKKITTTLLGKNIKDSLTFLVFMGMWCGDTKAIIPEFFQYLRLKSFPETHLQIVCVNRKKKSLDALPEKYHITNVPTIIVLKNKQELFRIVEYGTTGNWQDEILNYLP